MEIATEFIRFTIGVFAITLFGFLLMSIFQRKIMFFYSPIACVIGMIAITFGITLTQFLKIQMLIFDSILIVLSGYLFIKYRLQIKWPTHFSISYFLFLIVGIILIAHRSLLEGPDMAGGLSLHMSNASDTFWHLGLQSVLKDSIPPVNPIYSGTFLKGYHYLLDIFLNWLNQTFWLNSYNSFLRWIPILLSLLYASSTLLLLQIISKNKYVAFLGSILIISASSLSYLAPIIFTNSTNYVSAFWLTGPISYTMNLPLLYSMSILNVFLILAIFNFKKWSYILMILIGTLAAIKVYAFLIIMPIWGIIILLQYFKFRQIRVFIPLVGAVAIFLLLFLLIGKNDGNLFDFQPGYLIKTMYTSDLRLNDPLWDVHRLLVMRDHKWLNLVALWGIGVVTFLVGGLGLKTATLLLIPWSFKVVHEVKQRLALQFAVGIIIIGIGASLLLTQVRMTWNSYQFLFFVEIPLVVILILFGEVYLKSKHLMLVLGLLILTSIPTTVYSFLFDMQKSSYVHYSSEIIRSLEFLDKVPKNAEIIVSSFFNKSSLVPALGHHVVYYADYQNMLVQFENKDMNINERAIYTDQIFSGEIRCVNGQYLVFSNNERPVIKAQDQFVVSNKEVSIVKCIE